tara:strand:- start:7607 stop:8653 length:1047 start_codon:yes stop_codon:yes gene_type:complete
MKSKMRNRKLTEFSFGGGCGCKIDQKTLVNLIPKFKNFSKKLIVDFSMSDDAAVYKLNKKQSIVGTTDFFMPIVDKAYDFGKISAANAISDLYAMGAKPLYALAIVAMPFEKINLKEIKEILKGGNKICEEADIVIAGGHTINSSEPIYGLSVTGIINSKDVKKNSTAKDKDFIFLTKPLGVGILSTAFKKNILNTKDYKLLISSTTKLNKVGYELSKKKLISSMTDVTGFGLIGHLKEMCVASKKSAIIYKKDIPLFQNIKKYIKMGMLTSAAKKNWDNSKNVVENNNNISEELKNIISDPQTSGGLLFSCSRKNLKEVIDILKHDNLYAKVIGEFKNEKKTQIKFK